MCIQIVVLDIVESILKHLWVLNENFPLFLKMYQHFDTYSCILLVESYECMIALNVSVVYMNVWICVHCPQKMCILS